MLQIRFVQEISSLIKEADLDLVPVPRSLCANLSVVGFIFLVQVGDLCLHLISALYLKTGRIDPTDPAAETIDKTLFIVLAILVQILLLSAYFTFFLLVFRSTMGARTFEDLILH